MLALVIALLFSFQTSDATCDTDVLSLFLRAAAVKVDEDRSTAYALKQYSMLIENAMRRFYAECNETYWEGSGDMEIEQIHVFEYFLFAVQTRGAFVLSINDDDGRCPDGELINVESAESGVWVVLPAGNCLIDISVQAETDWTLTLSRLKMPDLD